MKWLNILPTQRKSSFLVIIWDQAVEEETKISVTIDAYLTLKNSPDS